MPSCLMWVDCNHAFGLVAPPWVCGSFSGRVDRAVGQQANEVVLDRQRAYGHVLVLPVYGHVLPAMDADAADELDGLLGGGTDEGQ